MGLEITMEILYSPPPSPGCRADLLLQLILPCYFCPLIVLLLSCLHHIGEGSQRLHNNSLNTFLVQFQSIPSCCGLHMQVTNVSYISHGKVRG